MQKARSTPPLTRSPQSSPDGGEVAVAGFGKFSVSERSAREGRNPATGEPIQIAASKAAKFSAAAALKKSLNG